MCFPDTNNRPDTKGNNGLHAIHPPLCKTDTLSVHNGTKKIAEVRLSWAGPSSITAHLGHTLTKRERQDIAAYVFLMC